MGTGTPVGEREVSAVLKVETDEGIVIDKEQIRSLKDSSELSVVNGAVTAPSTLGLQSALDWKRIERESTAVV